MSRVKVVPTVVVVACLLVIIANTPAILVDPLTTAVAQIRQNAARVESATVSSPDVETSYPAATLAPKSRKAQ